MILPFFVDIQTPSRSLKDLCFKNWFEEPCDIFFYNSDFLFILKNTFMCMPKFPWGINLSIEQSIKKHFFSFQTTSKCIYMNNKTNYANDTPAQKHMIKNQTVHDGLIAYHVITKSTYVTKVNVNYIIYDEETSSNY